MELFSQRPPSLHIEGLIDRLMRHGELWIYGVRAGQPLRDLAG